MSEGTTHDRSRPRRRIVGAALAASAVSLAGLTGCIDGIHMVGGGWFQDPGPSNPITVDNNIGTDIPGAIGAINRAAGTTIMTAVPSGGRVTFQQQTPICANGNCNDRRAMWVQTFRNGTEPYVNYCVIHYDPTFANGSTTYWDGWAMSHELGHCLDYPDILSGQADDYVGAMSYNSWGDPGWRGAHWWQAYPADDGAMLQRDGYGP